MTQNGKGDDPRPFSVDQETFAQHHEATFGKKIPWWERRDICEYSGLPATQSYSDLKDEYLAVLKSGMFFEWYPGLTGDWEEDKLRWGALKK